MTYLLPGPIVRTVRTALACAGAAAALHAGAARAEADVLERPALQSARAASSSMLAIALAGERVVAVGERGIVVYSDDGGAHWRQAAVPVSVALAGVRFVNGTDGWAVGHSGVILRTRDGGQTWTRQLDGVRAAQLALQAAQAGKAAPGATPAQALADAQRMVADGPSKPFLAITFLDGQRGLAAGAFGLLFATTDGGETWQPALDRLAGGRDRHLYAIEAAGGPCYIAGEQGTVLRADDCGGSYRALASPYAGTWFGAVGGAGDASGEAVLFGMRGNVYWSERGGQAWHKSSIATPNSLTAGLRLRDGGLLLADETGQLFVSADGGKTFRPVPGVAAVPVTGMVQAADGSVFLSGLRGVTKIAIQSLKVKQP